MEDLINDIQNRIKAEKLLFSDTKDYSIEEIKFMSNICMDRIRDEVCYMGIFFNYVPKLRDLYWKNQTENLGLEIYNLGLEVGKWLSKTEDEKELDYQCAYLLYNNFLGLPKGEQYTDFIKNRVVDPAFVIDILNKKYAYEFFCYNTNFLLTNNFLLIHYPQLYNVEYLSQLKNIATDVDKTKFATKEEYRDFKNAASATRLRIRRYERNHHVKIKIK